MTDPAPPPDPPTMTMLRPVAVRNVGATDVTVVDADGNETTLKPGESLPPPPTPP